MALYLCKELPLSLWRPRPEEICVIGAWLLQHPLSAVENRLACVILEGLNWGYTQVVINSLEKNMSRYVFEFVVKPVSSCRMAPWPCPHLSTVKWLFLWLKPIRSTSLTNRTAASYQRESNRWHIHSLHTDVQCESWLCFYIFPSLTSSLQVSYLASVLRLGVSPEASFSQWAWQLLLRLKLHGNAQNPKGAWSAPALVSNPPPELTHSPSMHSVIRAVKAGIPIGCYLSIAMTTVGHRFVLTPTIPFMYCYF